MPINQARTVLKQLRTVGRVERGYMGVTLRDVDPDVQSSLKLTRQDGALVQDVTPGSPGARVGLRPYDVIVSVETDFELNIAAMGRHRYVHAYQSRVPSTSDGVGVSCSDMMVPAVRTRADWIVVGEVRGGVGFMVAIELAPDVLAARFAFPR